MAIGVNATDDLIYDLQDQVQRVDRKVSRLLSIAGVDPDEAGELPGEGNGETGKVPAVPDPQHATRM